MDQDLFFCEKCGAPFPLFDDLQVHLFTTHYEETATAMDDSPVAPAPAAAPVTTPAPAPTASASPATPEATQPPV